MTWMPLHRANNNPNRVEPERHCRRDYRFHATAMML